jgi:hypothetical protein
MIETSWDDRVVEQAARDAIREGRTKLRRSRMTIGAYNGFSGEVRVEADWLIKVAIELELIPKPGHCSVCGSEKGRIDYHAEDYSRPLQVAPICQSCHTVLHRRMSSRGWAANWRQKVQDFGDGTKWFEFIPRS